MRLLARHRHMTARAFSSSVRLVSACTPAHPISPSAASALLRHASARTLTKGLAAFLAAHPNPLACPPAAAPRPDRMTNSRTTAHLTRTDTHNRPERERPPRLVARATQRLRPRATRSQTTRPARFDLSSTATGLRHVARDNRLADQAVALDLVHPEEEARRW
jgi:hypothetical protein